MNASGSCSQGRRGRKPPASRAPNLKGATVRFGKLDRNSPDYPSAGSPRGGRGVSKVQAGHAPDRGKVAAFRERT